MVNLPALAIASFLCTVPASGLTPHLGQLVQRHKFLQLSDITTTTHDNVFLTTGVIAVGIMVIVFACNFLWAALIHRALCRALAELCTGWAVCDELVHTNTGRLVCAMAVTRSVNPVFDPQFGAWYARGVLRLSSTVEIFQNREHSLGGEQYEYSQQWLPSYNAGLEFHDAKYQNTKPDYIEAGEFHQTCQHVEFGNGFLLSSKELVGLPEGDAVTRVPLKEDGRQGGDQDQELEVGGDGWHYPSYDLDNESVTGPKVGDVRVKFTVLRDCSATVVGLQTKQVADTHGRFLPYRLIRRSLCPCWHLTEEQEKEKLYNEAVKSSSDIYEENMWGGYMWWCLCWPCNLVEMFMTALVLPEIHYASFSKDTTLAKAYNHIGKNLEKAANITEVRCFVGSALMSFGLCLTFSPFTAFLKTLPFGIDPFLSGGGACVVVAFSFLVSLGIYRLMAALAVKLYCRK